MATNLLPEKGLWMSLSSDKKLRDRLQSLDDAVFYCTSQLSTLQWFNYALVVSLLQKLPRISSLVRWIPGSSTPASLSVTAFFSLKSIIINHVYHQRRCQETN
jgi:hypothetical protein